MSTPLGPSTGTFEAPSFTPLHPLQGGAQPRSEQLMPPIADAYGAGPCPKCGEFAVGADRTPDGLVHCRNNHRFKRGASAIIHGIDPAAHGADTSGAKAEIKFSVEFRGLQDGKAMLTVYGAPGVPALMSVTLAAFPNQEDMQKIVDGIATAAAGGISALDTRIKNPGISDFLDRVRRF